MPKNKGLFYLLILKIELKIVPNICPINIELMKDALSSHNNLKLVLIFSGLFS